MLDQRSKGVHHVWRGDDQLNAGMYERKNSTLLHLIETSSDNLKNKDLSKKCILVCLIIGRYLNSALQKDFKESSERAEFSRHTEKFNLKFKKRLKQSSKIAQQELALEVENLINRYELKDINQETAGPFNIDPVVQAVIEDPDWTGGKMWLSK